MMTKKLKAALYIGNFSSLRLCTILLFYSYTENWDKSIILKYCVDVENNLKKKILFAANLSIKITFNLFKKNTKN